jgi:hypothetical protein
MKNALIKLSIQRIVRDLIILAVVFFALSLVLGCSKSPDQRPLSFSGVATQYGELQNPVYDNVAKSETSLNLINGRVVMFFDIYDPSISYNNLGRVDFFNGGVQTVMRNMTFEYTMSANGALYNFAQLGADLFLWKSVDDGFTWTKINGGQPVVTHSVDPTSPWYTLWNPAVDVDENGTWHLLLECATNAGTPDQNGVGLCYSTATMTGDSISFDAGKIAAQVIPGGGNPYIKAIPGKGLLVIHGQLPPGGFWYVGATTFSGGTWKRHDDKFQIGRANTHVCDPHAIDLPGGGSLITMSFDQSAVYAVQGALSLTDLFNQLEAQ